MSRIGKKVIIIPEKTEVTVLGGYVVVRGPQGELKRKLHPMIDVKIERNEIRVSSKKHTLESKALWGTFASHISNMIKGVNEPFVKRLILEGIGFKSEVKGDTIVFALGFSHPVMIEVPSGLKVTTEKNVITVSGADKELVGSFAARLRALKKPEPYKGKGMRYDTEIVRRKQGKKSV